jgi:hypothetical protein
VSFSYEKGAALTVPKETSYARLSCDPSTEKPWSVQREACMAELEWGCCGHQLQYLLFDVRLKAKHFRCADLYRIFSLFLCPWLVHELFLSGKGWLSGE